MKSEKQSQSVISHFVLDPDPTYINCPFDYLNL